MLDPGAVYYNLCTEKRDGFLVVDAQSGERILPAEERAEIEVTARIEAERLRRHLKQS